MRKIFKTWEEGDDDNYDKEDKEQGTHGWSREDRIKVKLH